MIVTRFAPSPTGDPHIGNIRSALFAYLFAKSQDGKFLLRIEDTDRERYVESSIQTIKDALNWLEIAPENIDKPMIQSQRLEIYKKAALKLVDQGDAYVCDCTKERLEELRKTRTIRSKYALTYDGKCRDRNLPYSENCVIRMKIPSSRIFTVKDLVRGNVTFNAAMIDDQVILKSDGFPTYHLASVIDDLEMNITHVIRAEEWLPSTPKHILLYEMLGFKDKTPKYAHLPIILSPTHGKLSKRDGAVGIMEYKKMGYLPEAIINFMALLGWNPKTEEEFFTLSDLEKRFKIEQVNKAAAVFDINKLNHFNQHYLRQKPASDLISNLDQEVLKSLPQENLEKIVDLAKQRMATLSDFKAQIDFIINEPKIDIQKLVFRKSSAQTTSKALALVLARLEKLDSWSQDQIKTALENTVKENNLSNGDVFWPTRYALCGEEKSPPPEELAEVLGKEKTISRIKSALDLL